MPPNTYYNSEFEGTFIEFQPTDDVKDFGQTTIPFLDARAVHPVRAMPLSGAGLYYGGEGGFGGYIGLKLIPNNFL